MKIRALLHALSTAPTGELLWFGYRLRHGSRAGIDDREAVLAQTLYENAYVTGAPEPIAHRLGHAHERSDLVAVLRRSNAGAGRMQHVELVGQSAATQSVLVRFPKSRLTLHVPAARRQDFALSRRGRTGLLRTSAERLNLQPGFYFALSNAAMATDKLDRIYWNVSCDGAGALVQMLTTTLNQRRLAFDLKILDTSEDYHRCDAAVLYLPRGQYRTVLSQLRSISTTMRTRRMLGARTPLWTLPLYPGVGFAEDLRDGASYGQTRCRQVAAAIVATSHIHRKRAQERAILELLARMGVDTKAPYRCSPPVTPISALPDE